MMLVKGLGAALAGYGCFALFDGRVYAKKGISHRHVRKEEEPVYFRAVCLCYILVGVLILFVG